MGPGGHDLTIQSSDVIGHVTIQVHVGHFLLVVLWNQAYLMANVTHDLKRPLNKGQGHSFW